MISDGSIPNGKENIETDGKEQEYGYVNMELGLPRRDDDGLMHAIVKRRKINDEGKAVRTMNNNPLIDTRAYEVEFDDGITEFLTANIIAENLLAQVDYKEHCQLLLYKIINHTWDVNSIEREYAFTKTTNGIKQRKMTIASWQLYIQWKYGSKYWVALKQINQSYPVELADYARRTNIDDGPAFA